MKTVRTPQEKCSNELCFFGSQSKNLERCLIVLSLTGQRLHRNQYRLVERPFSVGLKTVPSISTSASYSRISKRRDGFGVVARCRNHFGKIHRTADSHASQQQNQHCLREVTTIIKMTQLSWRQLITKAANISGSPPCRRPQ